MSLVGSIDDLRSRLLFRFLSIPFLLNIFGLLFIYSASSVYALEKYGNALYFLKRQLLYTGIGWLSCLLILFIPFRYIFDYALVWWLLAFGVTATTLFWAQPINGACRWISIAGVSIQPSEFLAVATILYVTTFLQRHISLQKSFFTLKLIPFVGLLGLTSYILLAQPDFGSTVTLMITVMALFFVVGIPYRECLIIGSVLLPCFIALIFTKKYRLIRLMTFLDPWSDPQGRGFQIIQSLLAIGSGKLFGLGLGLSRQKFFYLPMQHTDFIFSIIAEEIGFIGTSFLLVFYIFFFYYGFLLSQHASLPQAKLFIIGGVFFISIKTILNCLVCTGMVPTKGLALPFISYGRSALIAQWILVGLIANSFLAKSDGF
ncbi:FtsW/RodA/SpoVE family cell cycle protein [Candidatus Babeliales bacterium]|nr:FtsW/RodA/SpoVE family cell cycle protein [Candidatus Babeliales bacterium]